jgi:hypothetical protein
VFGREQSFFDATRREIGQAWDGIFSAASTLLYAQPAQYLRLRKEAPKLAKNIGFAETPFPVGSSRAPVTYTRQR